jgi:hypothetical protein
MKDNVATTNCDTDDSVELLELVRKLRKLEQGCKDIIHADCTTKKNDAYGFQYEDKFVRY